LAYKNLICYSNDWEKVRGSINCLKNESSIVYLWKDENSENAFRNSQGFEFEEGNIFQICKYNFWMTK